ncbi:MULTISPECIES: Na+/H+ antiporter NhaC family protein [unclassified Clostridium]|uniref:Na+/H+ antiporter NhaC family protein n=1 Tax=unclassified Clostridium TaxID=2614128 RepID=UPI0032179560
MDVILGLIISTIIFITGVIRNIDTVLSLFMVLCIFFIIAIKRGVSIRDGFRYLIEGGKESLGVLKIFILIGAIVSLWMISGTVPSIVYYGINLIHPSFFAVSAFILSAFISMLLGTSFGTIGTVGISLIVMARAGGGNTLIIAGAILSGAYLGDRASPMSSSANLVASITNTNLYDNIKRMTKTSLMPLILSLGLYLILSLFMPVNYSNSDILSQLTETFNINIIALLPALIIIVLSFFKIEVKISMFISMTVAAIISFIFQHATCSEIIKTAIFGFQLPIDNPLYSIIKGGGIISMIKLAFIVFLSSALTGIFQGANMLDFIEEYLNKIKRPDTLFLTTIITSIISSMVGCTQVLAVMLTKMTMNDTYIRLGYDKERLALDLENSAIVIAPLIPWNVAVLVPLTTLGVDARAILFSFYLILLPLISLMSTYLKSHKEYNFMTYNIEK